MTQQFFGGSHTETKLHILETYCDMFSNALKQKQFLLIYIDAFAGRGDYQTRLDNKEILERRGSVRRILENNKISFDAYHLIELDIDNIARLKSLAVKHKEKEIRVHPADANEKLVQIAEEYKAKKEDARFVIFIDPFSTQFDFSTLEKVFDCVFADVLLLFNVRVVERLLPVKQEAQPPSTPEILTRIMGSEDWRLIYDNKPGLFGPQPGERERLIGEKISEIYLENLAKISSYQDKLVDLPGKGNQFVLIFLMNNDRKPAVGLARKLVRELKKTVRKRLRDTR